MQDICDLLVRSRRYRFAWIGMKRQGDFVLFPAAQASEGTRLPGGRHFHMGQLAHGPGASGHSHP